MSLLAVNPASRFQIARFTVVLALISLLTSPLGFASLSAQLALIPPQTIVAGQAFTYPVNLLNADGEYRFQMLNGPPGATLSVLGNGRAVFQWQPTHDLAHETVVIIQAFAQGNPIAISTRRLVLLRSAEKNRAQRLVTSEPAHALSDGTERASGVHGINRKGLNSVGSNASDSATRTASNAITSGAPMLRQPELSSEPTLPEISEQQLTVGKQYALFMRPETVEAQAVRINASALPVGATFTQVLGGTGAMLRWRPTADQLGVHNIAFVVRDNARPEMSMQREIRFTVISAAFAQNQPGSNASIVAESALVERTSDSDRSPVTVLAALKKEEQLGSEAIPQIMQSEAAEKIAIKDATAGSEFQKPYIEPIPIPLVSPGRIVKFNVVPRMPDHSTALLHIDRLPGDASFDENKDGTRTFYWPTTLSDQGEHIFRFTAIHRDDVNMRVIRDALVVVGDPSAEGSRPADMPTNPPVN